MAVASRLSKSLKVIRTDTDRSATYDFLITYHTNHGPISYHFRWNGDFSWKSIFLPHLFNAPAEGIPLSLGIGAFMDKKLESLRCRIETEVRRYLQPTGYNTRTWRMDGHQLTVMTTKTYCSTAQRRAVKCRYVRYPRLFVWFMVIFATAYVRLCRRTYIVRFRHLVLRQQKYIMRQWVASTVYCRIVARSSAVLLQCTILQLLPYLTLPVVILFWLVGVFLAEVRSTWTLLSGIKVGRNEWERRSQARHFSNQAKWGLKQGFFRGNARFQAGKIVSWECIFFQWTNQTEFGQDNGVTRNTGARCKIKWAHNYFTGAQTPSNFYRSNFQLP